VNKFGSFKKYDAEWPPGGTALESPVRRILTLALWTVIEAAVASGAIHPDALAAVERIRGHAFVRPVETTTIARAELPRIIRQRVSEGTYPPAGDYAVALRALELIGHSDKAIEGMIDLYSSQVMAFYDLDEHRYYAIDSPPPGLSKELGVAGPIMAEAIEVHELTHALQDQIFAAGGRAERLRYDWDAQLAYQSVLEGEATLVMLAWMGERSGLSLEQVTASDAIVDALAGQAAMLSGGGGAERYFAESLTFPYISGLRFIAGAYRRGGWAAVDAIDRNPPSTTAEIIDPVTYASLRAHDDLPARAGNRPFLVTHLGLFNWRFLLGQAPVGWRGDTAAVFQNDRCETSVLSESRWSTEDAARSFAESYIRFLEGRGVGARSSRQGKVVRVAYGSDVDLTRSFVDYKYSIPN
jgi:hypothetical protein